VPDKYFIFCLNRYCDAGMNAHLGKPIDIELLLKVIWENINASS